MATEGELNLELLAKECDIVNPANISESIKMILSLDERFESFNLVKIYNYFLTVCNEPEILMNIIKCSDRFRDKSTLPYLVDILLLKNFSGDNLSLKERLTSVRALCAKAIANYKDTSVVTPLLYCLNNKNEHYRVRLACADALGKIGDKYAVAPLIEIMKDEDERSVYVKESAASALGLIGDIRAIDPLVSILEANKGLVDKFTFLKERVIEALGKLKLNNNDRVFSALKNSLMDDSTQIRINAIEALMESEHPKAYETIYECLNDRDDEVKKNALIALYNMNGREILDKIIKSADFCSFLKDEAQSLIEEYEDE